MEIRTFASWAILAALAVAANPALAVAGKGKGPPLPSPSYTTSLSNAPNDGLVFSDGLGAIESTGGTEGGHLTTNTNERFVDFDFTHCADPDGCIVPSGNRYNFVTIDTLIHPDPDVEIATYVGVFFDADGYSWKIYFVRDQQTPPRLIEIDVDNDGLTDYMEVTVLPETIGTVYRKPGKNKAYVYVGAIYLPWTQTTVIVPSN